MDTYYPSGVRVINVPFESLPEFSSINRGTIIYVRDTYYFGATSGWVSMEIGPTGDTGGIGQTGRSGITGGTGISGATGHRGGTGGGSYRDYSVLTLPNFNEYVVYRSTDTIEFDPGMNTDNFFITIYDTWDRRIQPGYDDVHILDNGKFEFKITGYLQGANIVAEGFISADIADNVFQINKFYSNIWTVTDFDYKHISKRFDVGFICYDIFGREISPLNINIDPENNIITVDFDRSYYGYLFITNLSNDFDCNLTRPWDNSLKTYVHNQIDNSYEWTIIHNLRTKDLDIRVWDYGFDTTTLQKVDSTTLCEVKPYDGCTITPEVLRLDVRSTNDIYPRSKEYKVPQPSTDDSTSMIVRFDPYGSCDTAGAAGLLVSQYSFDTHIIDDNIIKLRMLRCYKHVFPTLWSINGIAEITAKSLPPSEPYNDGLINYGQMTIESNYNYPSSYWSIHHGMDTTHLHVDPRYENGDPITDCRFFLTFPHCNSVVVNFFKFDWEDIDPDEIDTNRDVQRILQINNIVPVRRTGKLTITRLYPWYTKEVEPEPRTLLYTYYHNDTDETIWYIEHNLNLTSNEMVIECFNTDGHPIVPSNVFYISKNEIKLYFDENEAMDNIVTTHVTGYALIFSVGYLPDVDLEDNPYYIQTLPSYFWTFDNTEESTDFAVQTYDDIGNPLSGYGVYRITSTKTIVTFPAKTNPINGSLKIKENTTINIQDDWTRPYLDPEEIYPTITLGQPLDTKPLSYVIIPIHLSNAYGRPIQIFPDPEPEKLPAGYPEHYWMNLTGKYDFITGFSGGTGSKLYEDSTGGTGSTSEINLTTLSVKIAFNPDQLYYEIDNSSTSPEAMINPYLTGKSLFMTTYGEGKLILSVKSLDNLPLKDNTFAYLKLYLKPEVKDLDNITIEEFPIGLDENNNKINLHYNSSLIKCRSNTTSIQPDFTSNYNNLTLNPSLILVELNDQYLRSGYDNSLSVSISNLYGYYPSQVEFFFEYDPLVILNVNVTPSDQTLHKITILEKISDGLVKVIVKSPPDLSPYTAIKDGRIAKLLFYIKRYNSVQSTSVSLSNPVFIEGFLGQVIPKIDEPLDVPIQIVTDDGYVHNETPEGKFIGSVGYEAYLPDMYSVDFVSSDNEVFFRQTTPTTTWHVKHNFNTFDVNVVFVRNELGEALEPEVFMLDENTLELHFEEEEMGSFLIQKCTCVLPTSVKNINTCEGMWIHVQSNRSYEWHIEHNLNNPDPYIVVVNDCDAVFGGSHLPYILEIIDNFRVKITFLKTENGMKIPILTTGRVYLMERTTVRLPETILDHLAIQQWDITDQWKINHNLNSKSLSFRCSNYNGHLIVPSNVEFVDDNNVILSFTQTVLGVEEPFAVRGYCIIREITSKYVQNTTKYFTYYYHPQFLWDWMNKESYGSPSYLPDLGAGYLDMYWRVRHNLNVRNPRVLFFDEDNKQIHPYRIYFINDQYFEAVFKDEFGQLINANGRVEVYVCDEEEFSHYLSPTSGSGGSGGYGGSGTTGGVGRSDGGKGGTGSPFDYMDAFAETYLRQPIVYFIVDYNQKSNNPILSDLDLPEGLIQTSETFIKEYVTSCDFSTYGAIGFDRCEFIDDPDQYHFIKLTTDKDYLLSNIENYDTTSLSYISIESSIIDAAKQIWYNGEEWANTYPDEDWLGLDWNTSKHIVLITSPRHLMDPIRISQACNEYGITLHLICLNLDEGYNITYANYQSIATLSNGYLYMPKTTLELREILDSLVPKMEIFHGLESQIIQIARTGETGGTGVTGGTGAQPTSGAFFQPKENDLMDKFNLGVSKLSLEVCYPNNQDRIVHFDEIYNSVLMLPHIFESGTGGTGGEYYDESGDVVHLTHWNYPGDVYRKPFAYSWSQDGTTVKVHFDSDTYKILWAVPAVKHFDVAYYEPLYLQYNVDTTSYAPMFSDTSDVSSWKYDTTSFGFWMDHQTPGHDYGASLEGHVSTTQIAVTQVTINNLSKPLGISLPAIISDISYDNTETHPLWILSRTINEWIEQKDFQSIKPSNVTKVCVNYSSTSNIEEIQTQVLGWAASDQVYEQYIIPDSDRFILLPQQIEVIQGVASTNGNYGDIVIYIQEEDETRFLSLYNMMLDAWNITFHIVLYKVNTSSPYIINMLALNNVESVCVTTIDQLITHYISFLDSLVTQSYILVENEQDIYDTTSTEMWTEAHYHDKFTDDDVQIIENQFIHDSNEYNIRKTAIFLAVDEQLDSTSRILQEIEQLLQLYQDFFDKGGYFGVHRFNFIGGSGDEGLTLPLSNNLEDISSALLNTENINSSEFNYNNIQPIIDNLNQNIFQGYKKIVICPEGDILDNLDNFLPIVKENPLIGFVHIIYRPFTYYNSYANYGYYKIGNLIPFYVYETTYDNYYDYPLLDQTRSINLRTNAISHFKEELTYDNFFLTHLEFIQTMITRSEEYGELCSRYNPFKTPTHYYFSLGSHPYWVSSYMPSTEQYVGREPAWDSTGDYVGDDGDHRMLIALDVRKNKNIPEGISGDMSRHGIIYNGYTWVDYGVLIGPVSGFVEEEWSQQYDDEDIVCVPDINVYGSIEDNNTIVLQFTSGLTGSPINAWKVIRGGGEKIEIVVNYGYLEYDGLLNQLSETPAGDLYK